MQTFKYFVNLYIVKRNSVLHGTQPSSLFPDTISTLAGASVDEIDIKLLIMNADLQALKLCTLFEKKTTLRFWA